MEAIKFNLSGPTAFFKKPDVNSYAYFTYNNIHKIALLGILGSIIGLKGYNQQKSIDTYPEFYDKLKALKISIVPKSKTGYFTKKFQTFTNNTGFYNIDINKKPCTLVYREQWLENVSWDIYILLDENSVDKKILNKLKDYLLNKKCHFIPYLGKNDHAADITNVELINLKSIQAHEKLIRIQSLFLTDNFNITGEKHNPNERLIILKEMLPTELDEFDNSYRFSNLSFTNLIVQPNTSKTLIYQDSLSNLYFF
nr:type I-B CRISPR-associated protein Cas5b [Clostridium botulinum]BAP25555.1 putative CRISPR-associated protein cas5 [Clostridium botulinum]